MDILKFDFKVVFEYFGFCWDVDEVLDNLDEFFNVLLLKGKCIFLKRKFIVFDNNVIFCF